jgi:hypothetical protein
MSTIIPTGATRYVVAAAFVVLLYVSVLIHCHPPRCGRTGKARVRKCQVTGK